jgi:hypothetical protein
MEPEAPLDDEPLADLSGAQTADTVMSSPATLVAEPLVDLSGPNSAEMVVPSSEPAPNQSEPQPAPLPTELDPTAATQAGDVDDNSSADGQESMVADLDSVPPPSIQEDDPPEQARQDVAKRDDAHEPAHKVQVDQQVKSSLDASEIDEQLVTKGPDGLISYNGATADASAQVLLYLAELAHVAQADKADGIKSNCWDPGGQATFWALSRIPLSAPAVQREKGGGVRATSLRTPSLYIYTTLILQ